MNKLTPAEEAELNRLRMMRWAGHLTDPKDIVRYDLLVERANAE